MCGILLEIKWVMIESEICSLHIKERIAGIVSMLVSIHRREYGVKLQLGIFSFGMFFSRLVLGLNQTIL